MWSWNLSSNARLGSASGDPTMLRKKPPCSTNSSTAAISPLLKALPGAIEISMAARFKRSGERSGATSGK